MMIRPEGVDGERSKLEVDSAFLCLELVLAHRVKQGKRVLATGKAHQHSVTISGSKIS